MTGVILAGGQNSRYPEKKAFIKISGETILSINLKILRRIFDTIVISANDPKDYFFTGLPLIGDVYNVRGPMTGILSCLLNTESDWIFTVACDMPFVSEALIRYLISKPDNFDAIVPIFGSTVQPLFAIYHKRLIPILDKCIKNGTLSLKGMLNQINCEYISEDIIRSIDSDERCFININTPSDLKKVMAKYYNK
jgi:molybdopterin-guanine dinucleotide biosynthesis protein A